MDFPSGDGVGNACEDDTDGDGVPDVMDVCPMNADIQKTDFRDSMPVLLSPDPNGYTNRNPVWRINNNVSHFFWDNFGGGDIN